MRFFSAQVEIRQIPHVIFESTSQFSFKCCINIQCHQTKLPYTFFSSKIMYFNQKKPIKAQIFSAQVKIHQVPHVIFESTSQFFFKCCIINQYHQVKLPYTFFSWKIMYFIQKKPIKMQIFEIFKCLCQNSSNSSCHFWKHKSVFLQMLHQYSVPSSKTPLYFF